MPNILDRSFKYVPAAKTDIRKTFKRVIAQQKAQSELPTAKVIDLTPGNLLLRKVTK